ncbi:hypothetical protein [Naumannella huperziae]
MAWANTYNPENRPYVSAGCGNADDPYTCSELQREIALTALTLFIPGGGTVRAGTWAARSGAWGVRATRVATSTTRAANGAGDIIRLPTKDSWANLKTLDDHFARHGADFGAKSADDYASMASEFFQRGGAQQIPTKITPDGTIRMFDSATNTFGSFAPNGMTKTFFKPTSPTCWSRQPGVLQ